MLAALADDIGESLRALRLVGLSVVFRCDVSKCRTLVGDGCGLSMCSVSSLTVQEVNFETSFFFFRDVLVRPPRCVHLPPFEDLLSQREGGTLLHSMLVLSAVLSYMC